MTRQQAALFRRLLLVFDVAVSSAAFFAALQVRNWLSLNADFEMAPIVVADYVPLVPGMLPLWALSLHWSKTADFRASYRGTALRYLRAVGTGVVLFVAAIFAFKLGFVARSFVVVFAATQLALLVAGRIALLEAIAATTSKNVDGHRVLVVGRGAPAQVFAASLRRSAPWSNKLVGFVGVPEEIPEGEDVTPVIGDLVDLPRILDTQPVDEVVFALPGYSQEKLQASLRACDERGIDVLLTMPSAMPISGKIELTRVTGFDLPMLGMSRVSTAQGRLAIKRLTDILGGLVGLAIAAPIMIVVAIAIKATSKGPILFKQVRAGRHGRRFTMYKFRSMVADAEELRAKLDKLNELKGPVFKIKRDPRITDIGRVIRKTSLDELPQLFNVFFGDMSLVGPRPPLPTEVAQYQPAQRRRLSVKPGITGLWQVSGRNQVDFDEWIELDLQYIDNWSLWLDVKIMVRTIPAVLKGTGS